MKLLSFVFRIAICRLGPLITLLWNYFGTHLKKTMKVKTLLFQLKELLKTHQPNVECGSVKNKILDKITYALIFIFVGIPTLIFLGGTTTVPFMTWPVSKVGYLSKNGTNEYSVKYLWGWFTEVYINLCYKSVSVDETCTSETEPVGK